MKAQWWDQCFFSRTSSQSAGVAIRQNKFTGDGIDSFISEDGRWLILVFKLDSSIFCLHAICTAITIQPFQKTGLFNFVPKSENSKRNIKTLSSMLAVTIVTANIDRVPANPLHRTTFKCTLYLFNQLPVIDAWWIINLQNQEYTWSKANRSL